MFLTYSHFRSALTASGIILTLLLPTIACHQPAPAAPAEPATTVSADTAKKNFFPVADYIRGEIHYVDSMPLAILKYTISDNHTDSSFIHPEEFHRIAGEFLLPELANGDFEKKYVENSFMDQTSGYLTFTYAARDKESPLQRVDVLAAPVTVSSNTNQVKSIYMQTSTLSSDTSIVKKMLWIAKKSLLIITSLQPREKPPVVRQVKVVWDSSPSE